MDEEQQKDTLCVKPAVFETENEGALSLEASASTDQPLIEPTVSVADDLSLWSKLTDFISSRLRPPTSRMANTHNSDTFLSRISARTGIPFTSDSPEVTGPVTLLGKAYPLITDAGCLEDFRSIIWVTYRKEYPCINGTSFSTDVGWGCMLRSGQMMVAEALKRFTLGRDWRLPSASDDSKQNDVEYAKIVSLFFDTPNAPLSIHHIATKGQLHDKKIGEWFGPMTISQVIKTLINDNLDISLKVHVASEGAVYTKELDFGQSGILVLIPVRLGLEGLNAVYYESIKACLGMKHCVGIAGGRPNSSLFFVGCSGDNLIYLDPHFLRPAIACKAPEAYTVNELESYQCTTPRTTPIDLVDPSMVLGFCFADEAEWEEFVSYSRKITEGKTPLFTIAERLPSFNERNIDLSDGDDF